jgi:glycosyltransferase involved in cell wall biosynthesis
MWIVHDWLTGMRGGERVLLELVRMYPQAKVATLIHVKGSVEREIEERVELVSWLNGVPGAQGVYRNLLPLYPGAIRRMRLPACDLVISSSHCVAKGIPIPAGAKHLCYSHGFLRYVWDMEELYTGGSLVKKGALRMVKPWLKRFDRRNESVDKFVANSQHEAERIERFYGREAEVVYPGVDVEAFRPLGVGEKNDGEGFYLIASALVPFKRLEVAMEAFSRGALKGKRLVVLGKGPEEGRLKAAAGEALGKTIEFKGWADRETVAWHYQRCTALVFPGEEHFGMTAVECQACGRAVVAYGKGGLRENVVGLGEERTGEFASGVFFEEQTAEGLAGAIGRLEANKDAFVAERIRAGVMRFAWGRFREGMERAVGEVMAGGR